MHRVTVLHIVKKLPLKLQAACRARSRRQMKGGSCRLSLMVVISLAAASFILLCTTTRWDSGYRQLRIGKAKDSAFDGIENFKRPPAGRFRCADLPKQYPDSIPPLVHSTSKDGRVAVKLQPLVQSWRSLLNSSVTAWRFMHWDDKQLAQLIADHYPQLGRSYAKLVNGLERSDIGRLVVLHHIGGVYVDLDVELRRDLSPLLTPRLGLQNANGSSANLTCCTAIWAQEPPEHAIFSFNMDRLIGNAVILTRANHSFLSYVLRSWPAWFEANWASKSRSHGEAVLVTGPVMLQRFFERYSALPAYDRPPDWSGTLLAEPDMFQPVWDKLYMPGILKRSCFEHAKLTEVKKLHCKRLAKRKFRPSPVPAASFTVHRYMHLSYTNKMKMAYSKHVYDLLPIHVCSD